jgi:hypothetical protein
MPGAAATDPDAHTIRCIPSRDRIAMRKIWTSLSLAFVLFAILIWAGDQVTLQGERTIYTVTCEGGAWDGLRCTGRLAAGDRYRFRSSRARNEVLYWIAGSTAPSGKYSDCQVKDRDNWICNVPPGQPPSVAHELARGRPTLRDAGTVVPFRAAAKWKWWALRSGIAVSAEADYGNAPGSPPPLK